MATLYVAERKGPRGSHALYSRQFQWLLPVTDCAKATSAAVKAFDIGVVTATQFEPIEVVLLYASTAKYDVVPAVSPRIVTDVVLALTEPIRTGCTPFQ